MATPAKDGTSPGGDIYTQIVDALTALFGVHPGYRAAHAKGIVCKGSFRPAATAGSVSRAPHFQQESTPVTVRFSDSTGVPQIPDNDPNASPHGMAIKFQLPDGAVTDIVAHSFDGFPVATAEEFLAFLQALAASGPGAAKPLPIEVFAASRPAAQTFLITPKPAPASFATEAYFGVNAFQFTNRDGTTCHGRYRIHPVGGTDHLDDTAAASKTPRYLFDELADRLAKGPAEFRLVVQLAGDGDPVHDGSINWPADRPKVELGRVSVTAVDEDSAAAERRLIFDPVRLVDGIELSADPLPLARSRAYSVSYERRNP